MNKSKKYWKKSESQALCVSSENIGFNSRQTSAVAGQQSESYPYLLSVAPIPVPLLMLMIYTLQLAAKKAREVPHILFQEEWLVNKGAGRCWRIHSLEGKTINQDFTLGWIHCQSIFHGNVLYTCIIWNCCCTTGHTRGSNQGWIWAFKIARRVFFTMQWSDARLFESSLGFDTYCPHPTTNGYWPTCNWATWKPYREKLAEE